MYIILYLAFKKLKYPRNPSIAMEHPRNPSMQTIFLLSFLPTSPFLF